MSDTIDKMQTVELEVARNIVARSQVLQRGAERVRAVQRHPDRGHPVPGADRDARRGQVPGPAAAQAAGGRARHRHGAAAGAGPAAGRGSGSGREPGRGADRRAVRRRDRPGRPRVRPGARGGGAAGRQRGDAAQELQRDVRQPVPAQPVADRAAGANDRLPGAERGTIPTGCPTCSRWTTWSPGCAGTPRTCSCWPGTRPRASGADRCRSPTWSGPRRRRSSSTAGWR